MQLWPWYVGGLALTAVMTLHWLGMHRMMAVSGRLSAMVNRVRFGPETAPSMTPEQLRAALLAATAAEFGPDAGAGDDGCDTPAVAPSAKGAAPTITKPQTIGTHALFLVAILVGGLASSLLAGTFQVSPGLRGELFRSFFDGPASVAALLVGGVLVGFGTRMAGGCTSGHGLCGVSRVQPGSLAATAAFFGSGVITSFLIGWAL